MTTRHCTLIILAASAVFTAAIATALCAPALAGPAGAGHDARGLVAARPVATRAEFDRVVIDGASFAYLRPWIGVEQVMGEDINSTVAGGGRIEFRVDPELDYTVTAFVDTYTTDPATPWQQTRHRTIFTLDASRTRIGVLDHAVYNWLAWGRRRACVMDALHITDAELAWSIIRMNARLDGESGDTPTQD